ncbi:MAG: ABC transporter substrate-binding protein [Cellulomonadaceae bacterium]|nr:ABC transporter substrate-binding protein [Cellulomonadaceae bacterium]
MNRNRTAVGAALLAAASLALTACSADTTTADTSGGTTDVRMATLPWIGYGGWDIAEADGIFADNGLNVEQTTFNTDADLNAAFVSGQVDVANVATHTALMMRQQGVPVQIVLVLDVSTTADAIVVPASVTSVADLAGMQIAYEQGTTSDLLLNYALSTEGLTIEDVEPVPMAASDAGVALIGDRVGAAVTYEPYITAALGENPDLTLLYTAGELPGLVSDVLVVSEDFVASSPDAVQALVDSWGGAIESYDADPDAGRAIIADAVGEDAEALSTAFDGVEFWGADKNASDLEGSFSADTLPLVLKAAQGAGIITGDVEIGDLVDPQFVTP